MQNMHISRIDLNLLVVFDTVFTEGGITPASRKLNLSQPAVSHALSRLRDVVGQPLFERQGRRIVPTPFARSIAGPIRDALSTVQRTLGESGRFDPAGAHRHFRVGMREALEPSVLPRLAEAVCAAGSRLTLSSARHDRSRLEADLVAGQFDVALDALLPRADRLPHELVRTDRLVVVVRRGHPALRRVSGRRGLSLDVYLSLEHIQVSSRRQGQTPEDIALHPLGRVRKVRLRCQSHAAACRVASETDLVVTVPELHAAHAIDPSCCRALPVPIDGLVLRTYMYWPENATADAANQWLREQIRAAVSSNNASKVNAC